jgi:hypothetical protein
VPPEGASEARDTRPNKTGMNISDNHTPMEQFFEERAVPIGGKASLRSAMTTGSKDAKTSCTRTSKLQDTGTEDLVDSRQLPSKDRKAGHGKAGNSSSDVALHASSKKGGVEDAAGCPQVTVTSSQLQPAPKWETDTEDESAESVVVVEEKDVCTGTVVCASKDLAAGDAVSEGKGARQQKGASEGQQEGAGNAAEKKGNAAKQEPKVSTKGSDPKANASKLHSAVKVNGDDGSDEEEKVEEDHGDEDEDEEGSSDNDDECDLCGKEGELVCCDGCPRAFHTKCLNVASADELGDPWYCTHCSKKRQDASKNVLARRAARGNVHNKISGGRKRTRANKVDDKRSDEEDEGTWEAEERALEASSRRKGKSVKRRGRGKRVMSSDSEVILSESDDKGSDNEIVEKEMAAARQRRLTRQQKQAARPKEPSHSAGRKRRVQASSDKDSGSEVEEVTAESGPKKKRIRARGLTASYLKADFPLNQS